MATPKRKGQDAAQVVLSAMVRALTEKSGEKDRGPMDSEVLHQGNKIILPAEPTPMGLLEGATILEQMHEEQEQEVAIVERISGAHFVDGLVAFSEAMEEVFGWTRAVTVRTFFGDKPPVFVDIPVDVEETRRVLTGRFEMPNISGFVEVASAEEDGMSIMMITGKTQRKFQPLFEKLAEETRRRVKTNSIFKNKSFELLFTPEGKISDSAPRFIDLRGSEEPIFSRTTEMAVQANILTPIQYSQRCRDVGIPLKRGVLLEGPYGTGKTLVSRKAGQEALKNGWTHLTIKSPKNLARALEFARRFQPAVVFVEDIDREMQGEDRTSAIDLILNTLDGVDSKRAEVMVVFTSNHAENINRAMMRPGRLDAVITVEYPDEEAAVRLTEVYAGALLDPEQDYHSAGASMAGQSPAVIREIVERAKLYAIGEIGDSGAEFKLTPQSLVDSAATLKRQLGLLEEKTVEPTDAGGIFIEAVAVRVAGLLETSVARQEELRTNLQLTREIRAKVD